MEQGEFASTPGTAVSRPATPIDLSGIDAMPRAMFGMVTEAELVGEVEPHSHSKAQLLHVVEGALTVFAGGGLWTVPPRCALWIPGGTPHHGRGAGRVRVESLYAEPALASALGERCAILFIRPLLRELIAAYVAGTGTGRHEPAREARLAGVLLDELADAPLEPIHVPMPADRRLRRLVETILVDPAARFTIAEWGARVGASDRTLSRLFRRETGLSFVRWRQQLHVSLALRHLAAGAPVSRVAGDLGYDSVSAFIAMFRRLLGVTPARYFDYLPSS